MKDKDHLFEKMQSALEQIIRDAKVKSPDELLGVMVKSAQCGLIAIASTCGKQTAIDTTETLKQWLINQPDESFPKVAYIRNSAVIPTPKTLQ